MHLGLVVAHYIILYPDEIQRAKPGFGALCGIMEDYGGLHKGWAPKALEKTLKFYEQQTHATN